MLREITSENVAVKCINGRQENRKWPKVTTYRRAWYGSVELVKICDRLPETRAGGHIASQLLRSGTSPAPNYAEARGAESDRDFVHKLKVVLKELNESLVWLSVIDEGHLLPDESLDKVNEECTVLCRITAASIRTVKNRCAVEKKIPGY